MGGERPAISVVVPTRDRAPRLERLLGSLRAQTLGPGDFELIVVDDASADRTAAVLEAEASSGELGLQVVRHEVATGPAAARNSGWRLARAPLVAFIDDDCEATPSWLERALAAAEASPGAIVSGPTTPLPSEAAAAGPFSRTRDLPRPGPWFETCNIVYPRSLLEQLGGFDERFPDALGEDTDLGWRGLEAGAQQVFAEDARVHHAVDRIGLLATLANSLRGADAVYVFRRHPELRRLTLRYGVVRNPALPRLCLAVAGLVAARHRRAAALLALPYARNLLARSRLDGASAGLLPFYVAEDTLRLYTSLRGSLRHRTLVL